MLRHNIQAERAAICPRIAVWMLIVVCSTGCGGHSKVPIGDAAENVRKLTLAYVQFAASQGGVGPANEAAFVKFLTQRNGVTSEEAKKSLISPRDNQPYLILWNQRPMGAASVGAKVPTPEILILEREGIGGIRYVGDGQVGIRQMSTGDIERILPAAKNE